MVCETMEVNRCDFVDGTGDDLKANIDSVIEKARARGMVGVGRFDFEVVGGDDYELKVSYYFDRRENEKEKAAREKVAEARKLKKDAESASFEDAEYAEFLRLKAKFEND